MIVAWLLAALRSRGPYPLLAISGEQGSAKTVLSKLLKALIDPNAAPVRALSREERELLIAANNGHLLAFDHVSGRRIGFRMPFAGWRPVAVLRCAGSTPMTRRCCFRHPAILLNGIEDVIGRPDLGDRAIFLTLAPIPEVNSPA